MELNYPVSVIIPCYRCGSTISRALESVLTQSYLPSEIILIDDHSEDDTLALLRKYEILYPELIKVISLDENLGVSNARNAGWDMATQPYLAFLDADDAWHCQKIEIQLSYMLAHKDVVMTAHEFKILSTRDGRPSWDVNITEILAIPISKKSLLLSNQFVTPAVMLRRDIVQRFIEGRRHMEDHMLWLEILFNGARLVKLSVPLVATYKKSFGETGLSAQLLKMEIGDLANYKMLLKMHHLNYFQWIILSVYSCVKFIRRLMISGINFLTSYWH